MKRKTVIATVAAVALIGGGTAAALVGSGDDEGPAKKTVAVTNDVNDTDGTAQDGAGDRSARPTDEASEDKAENTAAAKAGQITAADAIRAALRHTTGTAVSADLDDEGTAHVWEVDVLANGSTWHSIQVDPADGKVLGSHTEKNDDGDDAAETAQIRAALNDTSVSAAEAAEAAAAKGTVTSVDLDEESRDDAWDVDTTAADGTGSEWHVNPDSGKVTADRSND
ncbi:PepSY domain-containing protein [Streptomyces sp. WM6386]|uniref:PepSY domain-containing protein n=1 Tax=Streptomyces sp. WM6386 TaxID=1415558 RepID=UPI000619EBE4|nr:PepSY domain-containing protein [Streptomyces sp. WM6386]KKD05672.1 peptidase propeptide and YpeB domain protein [Streptomyces sp. WM6386]